MSSGKAMKIAITGISGRLGRILARRLHRRQADFVHTSKLFIYYIPHQQNRF